MIKRTFHSSSSSATYEAWFDPSKNTDGCTCPGWTYKRASGPRHCKHTDELRKGAPANTATPVKPAVTPVPVSAPSASSIPMPMLASPLKDNIYRPTDWVAEEKYDGHRILVSVRGGKVSAVSRYDKSRDLPSHIVAELAAFPDGIYDGELLVVGKTSSSVVEKANSDKLRYVIFDMLESAGFDVTDRVYTERRAMLEYVFHLFESTYGSAPAYVSPSTVFEIASIEDLTIHTVSVWQRGGEGLILKRKNSTYQVGQRSRDWIKIKQLHTAVLRITGFEEGKNGPYSTVVLTGMDGKTTTVKTKNNAELRRLAADPKKALGRKLRIEYQARTEDGSYRHPRWDRYEDE